GGRLTDIGEAIQQVAEGAGFSLVREYGGHGIGRALHEDPFIPNFGPPGRGPVLKPGLVLAVEPIANLAASPPRRRLDGGPGRRLALRPLRTHDRRHAGGTRSPHDRGLSSPASPAPADRH